MVLGISINGSLKETAEKFDIGRSNAWRTKTYRSWKHMSSNLKSKIIAAFIAAGLSAPAAFVAYDLTYPSEGLVQEVYLDPVGLPTACIGHMDKSMKLGQEFSLDECMDIFAADWKKHEKELDSVIVGKGNSYASEWQRAALTDFTFNLGIGNVRSSTLVRLVKDGRHREACQQLTRWVYAKGKKLSGLVTRRDNTMPYCLGELSYNKQKAYEQFLKEWKEYEDQ